MDNCMDNIIHDDRSNIKWKENLNNYELEYEVLKYYIQGLDQRINRAIQETVDSFGLHERMASICL